MSGFANTVFTLMIGWFRTVVSLIWSGLTDKNGGNLFTWIGNHWIVIALILFAVGTVVDLSVYLFRWKPLDVIRSYFDRKKGIIRSNHTDPASGTSYGPDIKSNHHPYGSEYQPLFASNQDPGYSGEDPYTRIDAATQKPAIPIPGPSQRINAERNDYGKTEVPADSPYRRPVPEPEDDPEPINETDHSRRNPDPVVRTRRRRINVAELFGNPEEDMIHFDPPKPVIDQSEAYHNPVYPRNWKDNGEPSDDSGTRS